MAADRWGTKHVLVRAGAAGAAGDPRGVQGPRSADRWRRRRPMKTAANEAVASTILVQNPLSPQKVRSCLSRTAGVEFRTVLLSGAYIYMVAVCVDSSMLVCSRVKKKKRKIQSIASGQYRSIPNPGTESARGWRRVYTYLVWAGPVVLKI